MKEKTSLIDLISDVTEITTSWIRKNVLGKQDHGDLTPLIEYALTSTVPGNDRALMVRLGCELKQKDWQIALPGMACWEFLNINLLVTDDFFDKRRTMRMGKKTICEVWGDEACLSLGFVLKSLASEILISTYKDSSEWDLKDALEVLEWATRWLYYSQFQENELVKKPLSGITLDMYMNLIKNATSVGIAGAFELGCVIGGGEKEERNKFRNLGIDLGHLLQIRDDLIDYIYDESLIKKGPFNDLFSRKRRLPLLVAYWKGTLQEKQIIDKILEKEFITLEDSFIILNMIVSSKVEKMIKNIVQTIADEARKKLLLLPHVEPARSTILELIELFSDL